MGEGGLPDTGIWVEFERVCAQGGGNIGKKDIGEM
jgi:hypothetical protein